MKTKQFGIKGLDEAAGEVTAVIATLNVKDLDGDVTLPGAFGEQEAQIVPTHDWTHVPIGRASISEKGDVALAKMRFNLDVPAGRDWFGALKFDFDSGRPLQQYSYGYDIQEAEAGQHEGEPVQLLKGLKVLEVSPVLLGAGLGTGTLEVKNHRTMEYQGEAALAAVSAYGDRLADLVAIREAEGKEGRTLSRANRDRLQRLVGLLADVRGDLDALLEATDMAPTAEPEKAAGLLVGSFARTQSRIATMTRRRHNAG